MQLKITSPGCSLIFDEVLVNAADNKQRDKRMKRIDVVIDEGNGACAPTISVKNDGKGIPVQVHKQDHHHLLSVQH